MNSNSTNILTTWFYSKKEWNTYVKAEKANKVEENIFFGIGILLLGIFGLMVFREASFLTSFVFTIPIAILVPFLRIKISYPYLKATQKNAAVTIFKNKLQIGTKQIIIFSDKRQLKYIAIIDVKNLKFLEFTIEWPTRKGPTNDEFRVLIPDTKLTEAQNIVNYFRDKQNAPETTFGDVLKTLMK